MLGFLRRHYLSIDPRTLGLVRIAIACLLFVDLVKRWLVLPVYYINSGLLPNHRVLWRPLRRYTLSFFFALSERHEVVIAFVLIALVYLCFLVGYRTRLMHVLSWLCLVSLQVRVDMLSNGADFVFSDLVLWTLLLPLGRRFSFDAVRASLHHPEHDLDSLQRVAAAKRDTRPVVSLAVLAATLQLVVIYAFNAISKRGVTWEDGSAVYWMVHQERIVTAFGLFAREHFPLWMFQGLTYATLIVEAALPLLILSPWGRPWTRRVAIALVFGLHTGIALMSNLGLFSPIMMVFSLLLLDARDWDAWEAWARARAASRVRLRVDASDGLCWQLARLWTRLDVLGRIELQPWAAELAPPEHGGWIVEADGRVYALEPALRSLAGALPLGVVWVGIAQLKRPFSAPLVRWVARNRVRLSSQLGLTPAAARPGLPAADGGEREPAPVLRTLQRLRSALVELAALALLILATSQTLDENRAIPSFLKHDQPRVIEAGVAYFRLNQGWSMFAPEAPTHDAWIVIDALTVDGRHIDPYNQFASRVADATLRSIPARLGESAVNCDYIASIVDHPEFHQPLRDWIMDYHLRTHRPNDAVRHFKAYAIEQDSPAPGEREPRNVTARVFLRE